MESDSGRRYMKQRLTNTIDLSPSSTDVDVDYEFSNFSNLEYLYPDRDVALGIGLLLSVILFLFII